MTHAEAFRQSYQEVLDSLELPERVALAYEPVSCLAEHDGRGVWLLRRRCDGAPFVLKVAGAEGENLEVEFQALVQLFPVLAGAVPLAVDCFAEGDRRFLVRSYLPGESLVQFRERTGGCSGAECTRIGRRLCVLLEQLHGRTPPIIHRDIKPENIVLGEDGAVGLIDFGIARRYKPERATDTRLMGSKSTAAPEQYGFAQTDERTDLYALGTTLIWLLTGSYDRESLAGAPVSRRLKRVLAKCTAFSPQDRYRSAAELRAALSRPRRRRAAVLAAACAAACLLGLGAVGLRWSGGGRTVEFSSACLEAAVRAELDRPEGAVTYRDLAEVERLALVGQTAFSREQEYRCTLHSYLDGVDLHGAPRGDVEELSLLADMPNLRELYLCSQRITDLSPLAELPLETLALTDNFITDPSPLAELDRLQRLWLGGNELQELEPLSGLESLRFLNLDGPYEQGPSTVASLDFLRGMSLTALELGGVEPLDGDWSPLAELPGLRRLVTWHLPVEAYGTVGGLDGLSELALFACQAEDLTALGGLRGLESLHINDGLRSLVGVQTLERLTFLHLDNTLVTDLSPLDGLPLLAQVELAGTRAEDFSPLLALPSLRTAALDGAARARVEAAFSELPFNLETLE